MRQLIVLLIAFLAAFVILIIWIGLEGSSAPERWLQAPLKALINAHLNGELTFEEMDYEAPGTVHIENIRITSEKTDILIATHITLSLAEVPSMDQPLRIKELHIEDPQVRLIRKGSGYAGFSNLFTVTAREDFQQVDKQARLSEVLEIRQLEITNGSLYFENATGTTVIDAISTVMTVTPQQGWYSIHAAVNRKPHFDMQLFADVNLDTLTLRMDPDAQELLQIGVVLHRENDKYLPPEIAAYVQRHQARGELHLTLHGLLPLEDLTAAEFELKMRLDDAQFAVDQFTMPVESIDCYVEQQQQVLSFSTTARVLAGEIEAGGEIDLLQSTAEVTVNTIEPLELKETIAPSSKFEYAGLLAGRLNLKTKGQSLSGEGNLELTNADFQQLMADVSEEDLEDTKGKDAASVDINVYDDHILLKDILLHTSIYEVRGGGKLFFDETIDITLTIRPGGLGKILGVVTQRFDKKISGSLRDPKLE